MLSSIEKCQLLAIVAHKGQKDKGGSPYILHPAWVAANVEGEAAKCVAWLHDVVEDTDFTFEDIECLELPKGVPEAVRAITKRDGEDYADYMFRVKENPLATYVKLADLKHNMNVARFTAEPTKKDLKRIKKYEHAFARLSLQ